jgi:hypothetical protein
MLGGLKSGCGSVGQSCGSSYQSVTDPEHCLIKRPTVRYQHVYQCCGSLKIYARSTDLNTKLRIQMANKLRVWIWEANYCSYGSESCLHVVK